MRWILLLMLIGVLPATAAERSGATLYREACAHCHGRNARGDGPGTAIFTTAPRNLRSGIMQRYPIHELVRRIREGTPLDLSRDLGSVVARAGDVALLVRHLRRLPDIDSSLVRPGTELWIDRCEGCHGPWGKPWPKGGPANVPDLSQTFNLPGQTRPAMLERLRHFGRRSAALGDPITRADAETVLPYAALFTPGMELFGRYCSGCHGENGRPVEDIGDTIGRPSVIFDRTYMDTHDDDALAKNVWHMLSAERPQMPHLGRHLDDDEVRRIVLYLRGLKPDRPVATRP
jgi:mono/diheme cytochrome c family protein